MTWHESSGCVVLEPAEVVLTRARDLVSFMRTCDFHGKSMLRNANCTRNGVRFYLDKDLKRELDPFQTLSWMKTVEYLMSWQRDQEKAAAVTAMSYFQGHVEWRILNSSGREEFSSAPDSLDGGARRLCGRLLESVRPEPARRLGADLAARKFVSDSELRRMLAV